ncbi:GIN domain-containing protein [Caulobacter sp. DWP3-1-3b2]|uniref:GIN domain-containing protein n=1 Tax=Caulobacter sp. DWP3-1-3b2 TaxID=2804643 RepID=UPI003CFBC09E
MIRNLTIVAVASFVLALGCFGGAAALGGRELLTRGWTIPMNDWHIDVSDDDDHVSITPGGVNAGDREETTRQIAWAGAEALQIDLPADVTYTQAAPGAGASIKVSGPRFLVDRVEVENGRIRLKGDDDSGDINVTGHGIHISRGRDALVIEVTAPAVRSFTLNGSGDLDVRAYDQPTLDLEINGSGAISAHGKTAKLDLQVSGSGEADLGGLDAGDTKVAVAGSGEAKIAPHGATEVEVAGSGEVEVITKPTSLVSNVAGSGEVHQNW